MNFPNVTALMAVDFGSTKTWTSVNGGSEQTVTVPGLRLATDKILGVTKPTFQSGLGTANWRISADDTLAIGFVSTGAITPTANETWTCLVARLSNTKTDAVA